MSKSVPQLLYNFFALCFFTSCNSCGFFLHRFRIHSASQFVHVSGNVASSWNPSVALLQWMTIWLCVWEQLCISVTSRRQGPRGSLKYNDSNNRKRTEVTAVWIKLLSIGLTSAFQPSRSSVVHRRGSETKRRHPWRHCSLPPLYNAAPRPDGETVTKTDKRMRGRRWHESPKISLNPGADSILNIEIELKKLNLY